MCGITGYLGDGIALDDGNADAADRAAGDSGVTHGAISSTRALELAYRGYDSPGLALVARRAGLLSRGGRVGRPHRSGRARRDARGWPHLVEHARSIDECERPPTHRLCRRRRGRQYRNRRNMCLTVVRVVRYHIHINWTRLSRHWMERYIRTGRSVHACRGRLPRRSDQYRSCRVPVTGLLS